MLGQRRRGQSERGLLAASPLGHFAYCLRRRERVILSMPSPGHAGDDSWVKPPSVTLYSIFLSWGVEVKRKLKITSDFRASESRLKLYNWRKVVSVRTFQSFVLLFVGEFWGDGTCMCIKVGSPTSEAIVSTSLSPLTAQLFGLSLGWQS